MVSSCLVVQSTQIPGPFQPRHYRLSQVNTAFFATNYKKVLTFSGKGMPQIFFFECFSLCPPLSINLQVDLTEKALDTSYLHSGLSLPTLNSLTWGSIFNITFLPSKFQMSLWIQFLTETNLSVTNWNISEQIDARGMYVHQQSSQKEVLFPSVGLKVPHVKNISSAF